MRGALESICPIPEGRVFLYALAFGVAWAFGFDVLIVGFGGMMAAAGLAGIALFVWQDADDKQAMANAIRRDEQEKALERELEIERQADDLYQALERVADHMRRGELKLARDECERALEAA
jgi:hypothetical protein